MSKSEPLFQAARLAPHLVILLLAGPVLAGLAGTLLPAFSYLPVLGREQISLEAFRAVLNEPNIGRSALLSLWTGIAATFVSVMLAGAIMAATYGAAGWRRMVRFLSPILSVPHAAAAFGLMYLIMPSGFLSRMISPQLTGWLNPPDILFPNDPMGLALIAGLAAKEVPFLILMLIAAAGQVDAARAMQITATLGYGRIAGFVYTLWPQLYRQIRLAVFAVLAFSATVVDVALILGPATPQTLSVQLVQWMNDPDLSMRFTASAGAVVQLALVLALFLLWVGMEKIGGMINRAMAASGQRFARERVLVATFVLAGWMVTLATLGGLALLALWSVSGLWPYPGNWPDSFTAKAWMQAAQTAGGPLATTFGLGFVSALLATLLCVLCLISDYGGQIRRVLDAALTLPLIVPQIAFLFGLQIFAIRAGLGYGFWTLVLIHLVFVLPYVFLSLTPAWRALDRRYGLVAQGLGKSRTQTLLKIEVPLLARPLLTAFALGFAVSAGLYLPTLLIGAGRMATITTEAVALAAGGSRRTIGAYAFLQAIVPFAGFLLAFALPAWLFRNRAGMRAA
ncbi:MAG: ABC transporter permease subunit [Rhizobiaceae bacterium]